MKLEHEQRAEFSSTFIDIFAKEILDDLHVAYDIRQGQDVAIRQAALDEIRGMNEGDVPTVLPATAANPHYAVEHEINRVNFLCQRLSGRVLDIGSGSTNELTDVIPDNAVTYLDSQPFPGHEMGDARQMRFQDGAFDSVYSRNCVQADTQAIIREAIRVLNADHGVMVLASALASEQEMRDTLLSTLTVLTENGVDITKQCDLLLNHVILRHDTIESAVQSHPEIIITVRMMDAPIL